MTIDGSSIVRLREYLQALSPAARAMLVAELELSLLRDEDIAGSELELRPGENFLQKPFNPIQLLETIRRCLDAGTG